MNTLNLSKDSTLVGQKCVVTGASGVIGRALIQALTLKGASVIAVDRSFPRYRLENSVPFYQVDLLVPNNDYSAILQGASAVFHLAARMPQAKLTEAQFHQENVEVTETLVRQCIKHKVNKLVFASTIEVYGVQEIIEPLKEDDAKIFTGHYSKNKYETEQDLLNLNNLGEIEIVALRMPMIFGPGFYHEKSMLALFYALKHNLPIPLPVADAKVSFVSSKDVAEAMILALLSDKANGESFNIAAADYPLMLEFFEDVKVAVGSKSKIFVLKRSLVEKAVSKAKNKAKSANDKVPILGTPAELVPFILTGGAYSIEKARNILNFEPQLNCAESFVSAYRWYFNLSLSERLNVMFLRHV
jgi:nucleoside-diphosphate-sugar epimerase